MDFTRYENWRIQRHSQTFIEVNENKRVQREEKTTQSLLKGIDGRWSELGRTT